MAPNVQQITIIRCELCGSLLSNKDSLRRHLNKFHPNRPKVHSADDSKMVCGTCRSSFSNNMEFERHIKELHGVNVVHKSLRFKCQEEFDIWLRSTQETDCARFVKMCAKKKSAKIVNYYRCHRSGVSRSQRSPGTMKREPKCKGSYKTNSHCPARIRSSVFPDGSVQTDYCRTHFGHNVLTCVPVSSLKNMASQVVSNIPCCIDDYDLQHSHITLQGLRNIVNAFSLDRTHKLYSDSSTNIEAWVGKVKAYGEDSCIILYKPKGQEAIQYPNINEDDFLLGIMTEGQREVLKQYGQNGCICMDSTRRTTSRSYELTTVLVLNDQICAFPAAFFISNRQDPTSMEVFLKSVKEKTGIIYAKTFMSDMEDTFYDSWSNVMSCCDYRLASRWHVMRAWQERLATIKSEEKRKETYELVYTLLSETCEQSFEEAFPSILHTLCDNDETHHFGCYIRDNYSLNCTKWARCYQKSAGLGTNVGLERLHYAINHVYTRGEKLKRLCTTILALMRFVNHKVYDKLLILEREGLSHKLRVISERHTAAISMPMDSIVPMSANMWVVFSPKSYGRHTVSLVDPSCSCAISCLRCKTCAHRFSCTCIDFCIKSNMCKHIHLICLFLMENETSRDIVPRVMQDEGNPHIHTARLHEDLDDILNEGVDPRVWLDEIKPHNNFNEDLFIVKAQNLGTEIPVDELYSSACVEPQLKDDIRKRVENSFSLVMNDIQNDEELLAFEKIIKNALPSLRAAQDRRSRSPTKTTNN